VTTHYCKSHKLFLGVTSQHQTRTTPNQKNNTKQNMRIQGKYIKIGWVAFIAFTVIGLLVTVARKKASEIKELKVSISNAEAQEKIVTEKHIEEVISKAFGSNLVGTEVKDLDISRIEQAVEEDAYVGDAQVYLDTKNRLQVAVTQREPTLRIKDMSGADYYLDQSGHKFLWSRNYTPRILIATGNIPAYQEDFLTKEKSLLKDLFVLNEKIQKDKFWSRMIQQIHVNNYGEFILVPEIGTHKILFGNVFDMDEKFRKLEIFYREGITYTGWKEYDVLDIRFKQQVVGRRL
jgi:cell division protein FtsQ